MAKTIFYSWQSDSPNNTNRKFIEDAINKAIVNLNSEIYIQDRGEEIELDRDTKGVPGNPPITETIFKKISQATIFIPDLSFVGKTERVGKDGKSRLLPNPNVLIEYGYAIHSLGYEKIIPIMNIEKLDSADLPFDMRHLRHPICYFLAKDPSEEDRQKQKEILIDLLTKGIGQILTGVPDSIKYNGYPTSSNPSTFLRPNESFTVTDRIGVQKALNIPDGPKLFLRLLPDIQIENLKSGGEALDLIVKGNLNTLTEKIRAQCCSRNEYGAFVYEQYEDQIKRISQLFLSGEIWGIDFYSLTHSENKIPVTDIENIFMESLKNYLVFAEQTLKVKPPLRIIAGITGIKNFELGIRELHFDPLLIYVENIIYGEDREGIIPSYQTPIKKILLPFFVKIWAEGGLPRPQESNE